MSQDAKELPLCPFHGDPKAMEFSSASKKYAACMKCANGEDSRSVWYRPIESWNNAFAWTLLDEKEKELAEVLDALTEMVAQHCHSDSKEFDLETMCLSANACALRLLGKLGVIDIDDRGMRVVFGKWKKQSPAAPEQAETGENGHV